MAIWNLRSKRERDAAKSGASDVYQYTIIPHGLRVQIFQILVEAVGLVGHPGNYINDPQSNPNWDEAFNIFCREKGVFSIGEGSFPGEKILRHMMTCETEDWLDLLELLSVIIVIMEQNPDQSYNYNWSVRAKPSDARNEINYRLREAGVGYQFEGGRIVRVDSEYIHAEVVKPALLILAESGFSGPREEFLAAHQHYRRGESRQAVAMAANALESTFKAIFDQKRWSYQRGARISDLVKVAKANKLWPDYLDASFDQLIATLQSGLPKIRDNDASHGQGSTPREVPAYIASYALHLAASKIVFLAEAAKS